MKAVLQRVIRRLTRNTRTFFYNIQMMRYDIASELDEEHKEGFLRACHAVAELFGDRAGHCGVHGTRENFELYSGLAHEFGNGMFREWLYVDSMMETAMDCYFTKKFYSPGSSAALLGKIVKRRFFWERPRGAQE